MSPEIAVAVISGAVLLVGGFLERRHATRMSRLERQNTDQHARGYGLLESIDKRTQTLTEDVGELRSWTEIHDALYPTGHTTNVIVTTSKEPAKP